MRAILLTCQILITKKLKYVRISFSANITSLSQAPRSVLGSLAVTFFTLYWKTYLFAGLQLLNCMLSM